MFCPLKMAMIRGADDLEPEAMEANYPMATLPATPDYVLSVIQDGHRQACEYDSGTDPWAVLSYDTTVSEWRYVCDLVSWRSLGRALNDMWGIRCSDAEWRAVLEPARQRTVRDVCNLIAGRAVRPAIQPATVLGKKCAAAGAFLTVRSLLGKAGASADAIAPSTELAPYTRQHLDVFLGGVSRLAPGVLPPVKIQKPVYDAGVTVIVLGMTCLIVGFAGLYVFTIAGVLLFTVGFALTWFAARRTPLSVEFGELRTFRDLAILLADGSSDGQSRYA
ncbi:MAG: hypothetical protein U0836_16185 [Pirellulales bacterium]